MSAYRTVKFAVEPKVRFTRTRWQKARARSYAWVDRNIIALWVTLTVAGLIVGVLA